MKTMLVLYSYHHKNTEKIAEVFAKVLDAKIKSPQEVHPQDLQECTLVGFGSGIYGAKHHSLLLELVETLSKVTNKYAFLFSTSAIISKEKVADDHSALRSKLKSKGYIIIDEFACKGFNTNSFLKYFGGMNKGRPNAEDLKNAENFAHELKKKIQESQDLKI